MYFDHLVRNLRVSLFVPTAPGDSRRRLMLFVLHSLHGLLPCRYTEHRYWKS